MQEFVVRVQRKWLEATDICCFELVRPEGGPLPPFSAGAHIDVHLPDRMIRQYSICNDPQETHRYLLAVLREPASRGGSRMMHDGVREGQLLTVGPPKNRFGLAHSARRSILLAGGIGITPILCMAERLHALGHPFEMHYCTRSRERTAFHDRIRASAFERSVSFYFDDSGPRLDLASLARVPRPDSHVYVCGPRAFMDWTLETFRSSGWPDSQLHVESFAGEVVQGDCDSGFELKLGRSGRVVPVGKDQTVVEALLAAGVAVPVSCEQGVCGTCLTRVLEGEPDHRDMYLTSDERAANDRFLPCCSRSRTSQLVLDL